MENHGNIPIDNCGVWPDNIIVFPYLQATQPALVIAVDGKSFWNLLNFLVKKAVPIDTTSEWVSLSILALITISQVKISEKLCQLITLPSRSPDEKCLGWFFVFCFIITVDI